MRLFKILPVFALIAILFQGCSSTTTVNIPPPVTPSTTVSFKANMVYTYNQDKMDTATSSTPEMRDSSNRDVITGTVIDTNGSYSSKTSGVVKVTNSHSNGAAMDTSFYYQSAGDLYQYNYGLTTLNSIPGFVTLLGKPLDAGWVLQAKLGAGEKTTWIAGTTSATVTVQGLNVPVTITDNATQQKDTLVTVNGKTRTAKHAVHSVVAVAEFGGPKPVATVLIDSYVTPEDGSVLNISHSFEFNPLIAPKVQVAGQYTVLTNVK